MCDYLNVSERETHLFKCLCVPSDDVRIEIVKSLMTVAVDRLQRLRDLYKYSNCIRIWEPVEPKKLLPTYL